MVRPSVIYRATQSFVITQNWPTPSIRTCSQDGKLVNGRLIRRTVHIRATLLSCRRMMLTVSSTSSRDRHFRYSRTNWTFARPSEQSTQAFVDQLRFSTLASSLQTRWTCPSSWVVGEYSLQASSQCRRCNQFRLSLWCTQTNSIHEVFRWSWYLWQETFHGSPKTSFWTRLHSRRRW